MILGLTLRAFSKMSLTAASLPPMYLLKISDPFTLKYFILNSSSTAAPRALFPLPVAPYSNIPRGSLIGTVLNRKAYFIGFYIILFIVFLANFKPAILEKSKVIETCLFFGVVCEIAYLINDPNVRDYVLYTIYFIRCYLELDSISSSSFSFLSYWLFF